MSDARLRRWVRLAVLGLIATTAALLLLRYEPSPIHDILASQRVGYAFLDDITTGPVDWLASRTFYWQYTALALALCILLILYTRNLKSDEPGATILSRVAVAVGVIAFAPIALICVGLLVSLGIRTIGEFFTAAAVLVVTVTVGRRVRRRLRQRWEEWEQDQSQTPAGEARVARARRIGELASDAVKIFAIFAVIPLAFHAAFIWQQLGPERIIYYIVPDGDSIFYLPAAALALGVVYDLTTTEQRVPSAWDRLRHRRIVLAVSIVAGAVAHTAWQGMDYGENFSIEMLLYRYVHDYGWQGSLAAGGAAWFAILFVPLWRSRGNRTR